MLGLKLNHVNKRGPWGSSRNILNSVPYIVCVVEMLLLLEMNSPGISTYLQASVARDFVIIVTCSLSIHDLLVCHHQ